MGNEEQSNEGLELLLALSENFNHLVQKVDLLEIKMLKLESKLDYVRDQSLDDHK